MQRTDSGQQDRCVRPGDQEIDRAVVNDLHHLFSHARFKPVVNAGHCIQSDHRRAIYGGADHTPDVSMQSSHHDRQHQNGDSDGTADNVGHHIGDILAAGIIR